MVQIFFDIETYSPDDSGPRLCDKVISIAYKIGDSDVTVLKEWELGEREVLTRFLDVIQSQYRPNLIGHNILRFDIPVARARISQTIRKGLRDMIGAIKWDPSGLIIDRFGLNQNDIEDHGLTWIPNLKSGSGRDPDPRHKDVRGYISRYGVRKCESNALLKDEETLRIGQKLCRDAIESYYGADALARFKGKREDSKKKLRTIYENPVWSDVREALRELIEGYGEDMNGEVAPLEAKKVYVVKIYQRIDKEHYLWGRCPVCMTLFDYDQNFIDKIVRCRVCNVPMRLIKGIDGDSNG